MDLIFGLPDVFILSGVLIIIIGFILKIDTLFTVVLAGIVTGIVSGMSISDILTTLGNAFVANRYMTIFVLSLPVIGMLEKNGLKQVATEKISKITAATQGRILSIYLLIRTLCAAGGLRLQGHILFIRPLVLPMADGAAKAEYPKLSSKNEEKIKGLAGAAENFGNFFGQDAFVASSGVLLIVGTLVDQGVEVTSIEVAAWSILIACLIVVIGSLYFMYHDYLIKKSEEKAKGDK